MDENGRAIDIRLPTPEEAAAGTILYSENMSHLLKMQTAVIEALAKVAPIPMHFMMGIL